MVVAVVDTESILAGVVVPIPTEFSKAEVRVVEVARMALTVMVEVARIVSVLEVPVLNKELTAKSPVPICDGKRRVAASTTPINETPKIIPIKIYLEFFIFHPYS